MTTPYNPETGKWKVYADPRQQATTPLVPQPDARISIPNTNPDRFNATVTLSGDVKAAHALLPIARKRLGDLHATNADDYEIWSNSLRDKSGVYIGCRRNGDFDYVDIAVDPRRALKALGPLHLNFDPSAQRTFGQSLLDKNNGFPLYFNETSNTSITSKGVVVAGGECSGCLYFNPQSTHPTDKTTAFVLSAEASGDGTGYLYSYAMGPSTWLDVGFFCSNDRTEVWLPGNESSINTIEQSSQPRILTIRTRSRDIIGDSDGSVGFTVVTELFLGGKKIDETSENRRSWGTYYGDNQNRIFTTMSSNSGGSITLNQKMLYDAFLSNSQISELTDNLAAKWGL